MTFITASITPICTASGAVTTPLVLLSILLSKVQPSALVRLANRQPQIQVSRFTHDLILLKVAAKYMDDEGLGTKSRPIATDDLSTLETLPWTFSEKAFCMRSVTR